MGGGRVWDGSSLKRARLVEAIGGDRELEVGRERHFLNGQTGTVCC